MPGSWSSGILFSWDICVTLYPHSNVLRHILSSSFHRGGSLSWENWNDLPRVTKLVSDRVTIRMQCLDCCSLQIAWGHHSVRKPRQPHGKKHQETRHVSEAFEVFPAHVRYQLTTDKWMTPASVTLDKIIWLKPMQILTKTVFKSKKLEPFRRLH